MSEEMGNSRVVAEVNVLDEILETTDAYDELAAELINDSEEIKAGKKKVASRNPVKASSSGVRKSNSKATGDDKKMTATVKTEPASPSVTRVTRSQNVKGSLSTSASKSSNANSSNTSKTSSAPSTSNAKPQLKLPAKFQNKTTSVSVKVEKSTPVKTTAGAVKVKPSTTVVKKLASGKPAATTTAVASKLVAKANDRKQVVNKVTKQTSEQKSAPRPVAVKREVKSKEPPKKSTDDDGGRKPANESNKENFQTEDKVAGSTEGRQHSSAANDDAGDCDAAEYDTRSEASSSSEFSDGSSSEFSPPFSSSSRSSSTVSESNRKDKDQSTSERYKRRKRQREISPVVYDKRSRSKERAPSKTRRSSSAARKDYYNKLKYVFRDARYYVIKSNNHENVALSKAKGVWSTPPQNEAKINQAIKESCNVILIYSVKESGKFQGFARVNGESRRDGPVIQWVLPPGLSAKALGGVFQVDWICRRELPFPKTQHLYNPWNDGKPVKIGRDGQEKKRTS
ncbi:hypothetical protein CHUAL_004639 [Chamberlinius hualienensis]